MKEIKKEVISIKQVVSSCLQELQQINSPEKINEDIVMEFKNRSRPIKLITQERAVWMSKVIFFDNEFLYVRVPPNFESSTGAFMLVEFPTKNGSYVIQSFVKSVRDPVLCLKFQDPRRDKRIPPPPVNSIAYAQVDSNSNWFNDDKTFIVRSVMEEKDDAGKVLVVDSIGVFKKETEEGEKVVSVSEKDTAPLKSHMVKAELKDLSLGGCSMNIRGDNIPKNSMLYLNLNLVNESYRVREMELLIFGVVRNVAPLDEMMFRYGMSFIRRLVVDSIEGFLQELSKTAP